MWPNASMIKKQVWCWWRSCENMWYGIYARAWVLQGYQACQDAISETEHQQALLHRYQQQWGHVMEHMEEPSRMASELIVLVPILHYILAYAFLRAQLIFVRALSNLIKLVTMMAYLMSIEHQARAWTSWRERAACLWRWKDGRRLLTKNWRDKNWTRKCWTSFCCLYRSSFSWRW